MNLKIYIEDMIKKAEEKFDEELMLEIIAKLKEQLKEIEFSDNDKAIYYDLLKDNDNYEDSFVNNLFHIQSCLEDDYYVVCAPYNALCEQQRYGLIKPDGKLRKVLMLYSLSRDGHAISHLKGKCECSEEYQDFNVKTKLELKNRVGALFMTQKTEEKYISYTAQKYICNNCGREYDESDICRVQDREVVSGLQDSAVFYNDDKIVISTFEHSYKYVKERLIYDNLNYRVIYNMKTGRQYAQPAWNRYTGKKTGKFRAFNCNTLTFSMPELTMKLSKEQFFEIGNKIYEYLNDKDAIPFEKYYNDAIEKETTNFHGDYGTDYDYVKVLAAYNSNPYIDYNLYRRMLKIKSKVSEERRATRSVFVDTRTIRPYTVKTIRNKNIEDDHDKYIDSLNISDECRKMFEDMRKSIIDSFVDWDPKYVYSSLVKLATFSKTYNRMENKEKIKEFTDLIPELSVETVARIFTNNIFSHMTDRVFNLYVKQFLKEVSIAQIEGLDFRDVSYKISKINSVFAEIIIFNKKYKIKKLYDFDTLLSVLKEDLYKYQESTYKFHYNEELIKAFNNRNRTIVDTISIKDLEKQLTAYMMPYEEFNELSKGKALLVAYTDPKTKEVRYYLLNDFSISHLGIRNKYFYKKMSEAFKDNKKLIRKDLIVERLEEDVCATQN